MVSIPALATNPQAKTSTTFILIGIAVLACLLTLYQWIELVQLRSGGAAPLCSFSASLDCTGVWNSKLSGFIHESTGIPIAGWGLAWSLVVLALSIWTWLQSRRARPTDDAVWALRLVVGAGTLISLLLLAYSAYLKVFCPTCLLFYLLVWVTAYLVFVPIKARGADWFQSALLSGGLLVAALAILIYPGLHTPRENLITARLSDVANVKQVKTPASPLEEFLNSLPVAVQQATSNSLEVYRTSPFISTPPDPKRITFGTLNAPVHMIEWTDIRCPHCKNLEEALTELRNITPPGSWSQETRHFPLDSDCNPKVGRSGGGVSCLAAKLEICLMGSPEFSHVRAMMFKEQANLTKERIWEIATKDPERRKALESCVASPETANTLNEDIDLAEKYQLEGTPLVVINGRKGTSVPAFILGVIMAKGHDDDPAFLLLPAPSRAVAQ
jgi:protein-disulfide isomerase